MKKIIRTNKDVVVYSNNIFVLWQKSLKELWGKLPLIEVGCGKGLFLEILNDQGVEICGFDPAYEG